MGKEKDYIEPKETETNLQEEYQGGIREEAVAENKTGNNC